MTTHVQIGQALQALYPGAQWYLSGDDLSSLAWLDTTIARPTDAAINAAIAALPPPAVWVPTNVILGRLTPAEYVAIMQAAGSRLAAGDGQLSLWLDMARTSIAGINLNDQNTASAKAFLVANGLLTQARADAIFHS